MRPPSGVLPHFNRATFRETVNSALTNLIPRHHIPDSVANYISEGEHGVPLLADDATVDTVYLDVIEDIMVCFVTWAAGLADKAQEAKENAALAEAEAAFRERQHFLDGAGPVRSRELAAKNHPDVLRGNFDARVWSAVAEYLERASKRMDKQIDVLKYIHRGLSQREHRSNTIPD